MTAIASRAVPGYRKGRRPTSIVRLAAILLALLAAPVANAICPRAVMFDLGDTLVQSGAGGLFFVKPGAQQMLDRLAGDGLQLGVITNVPAGFTRPMLDALLAEPEFLDQFDVVVLSSLAPAPKPNPLIYQHAHSLLPMPVAITDTAFVGETLAEIANSVVAPTSGARATGMIGVHLSLGSPSPLADHTIAPDQLLEFAELVATLCTVFTDGFESAAGPKLAAN